MPLKARQRANFLAGAQSRTGEAQRREDAPVRTYLADSVEPAGTGVETL
jgi:hypothetical protein